MSIRKTAVAIVGAALMAGGLTISAGGVANASSCTTGNTYVTPTSFPSHISAHTTAAVYTHIAPESACLTTGSQLPLGYSDITVYCYTMNAYDNEWLYVGAGPGRPEGWLSADSLDYDSSGSAAPCSL